MGKLTKRVRTLNNSKKKSRKGGGCGCGMSGGKRNKRKSKTGKNKRKVKGGSQHLEALPLRYYYPLNDHSSNLSDVSSAGSSTEQFSGGKKNKKKTRKQMKGGGIMNDFFNGPQLNINTAFSSKMLYDIQGLDQQNVADITKQPAADFHNDYSPLLV
jgi:hypothetical protein